MPAPKMHYVDYTEEELMEMHHDEAVEGLAEKRQRFCEYYIGSYNAKMAALKAGYNPETADRMAVLLKNSERCRRYIAWLKIRAVNRCMVRSEEILDAWVRIAFSDITDFIDIFPHSIRLKPSDQIDGQLVKSIKSGRDGVSIELYDKMKALDSLVKYVDFMPKDWKQKIEERKIALMEEEFELKKKLSGTSNEEDKDDGFLAAISKAATNIKWEEV